MSYTELKNFRHACDRCKVAKYVYDVSSWADLPVGWSWHHSKPSFSMLETSEELCDKCLEFEEGVEVKFE